MEYGSFYTCKLFILVASSLMVYTVVLFFFIIFFAFICNIAIKSDFQFGKNLTSSGASIFVVALD